VCLDNSAERECEQRQEDDEQASTISLGSYNAEGNMDNAHVELSAPQAAVTMTMMRIVAAVAPSISLLVCTSVL
jgi:hypothetical protein